MTSPTEVSNRIVVGVGGGIAAYKAVEVVRLLKEHGFHVSPVLTSAAKEFVGELTFSSLSSEPVRTNLWSDPTTPSPHTFLGQSTEAIVVVPTTAHLMARLAMGLADDLLTATILATKAPVILAPAMHTEMWEQPSVQNNVETLKARGFIFVGPVDGALAGGDSGMGRLAEPVEIARTVVSVVEGFDGPLSGRRIVISAGATKEPLDPVRYLTNRSSGRQGYALAEVAARMGASVVLVSASSRDVAPDVRGSVQVQTVSTAEEMAGAMEHHFATADVAIMAAAVADFTFERSDNKLKKRDGAPNPNWLETRDIVAALASEKKPGQIVVGFAAETTDVLANAKAKLTSKGVDLLVVNDVSDSTIGFDSPDNAVTILAPGEPESEIGKSSKDSIALEVLTRVYLLLLKENQ
jgi:phosphopantothenoylcysteine decarboxylase / phosphopantothenate---cysteine ligase